MARLHCHRARARARRCPPERPPRRWRALAVVVPDTLERSRRTCCRSSTTGSRTRSTSCARRWLRGERAIDIGANHGVYALPIAQPGRPRRPRLGLRAGARRRRAPAREHGACNGLPQVEVSRPRSRSARGAARWSAARRASWRRLQRTRPARRRRAAGRTGRGGHARRLPHAAWAARRRLRQDRRRGRRGRDHRRGPPILRRGVAAGDVRGAARRGARHRALVTRFEQLGYRAYRLVPGLDPGAVRSAAHARSVHAEPVRLPTGSGRAAGAARAAARTPAPDAPRPTTRTPMRRPAPGWSTCARSSSPRRCCRAGRAGSPAFGRHALDRTATRALSITSRSPATSPSRPRAGSPR